MSFRVTILELAPRWLASGNAGKFLLSLGSMFDEMMLQLKEGEKASFPDYAPTDALGLIGNDLTITQGPLESNENYRPRLRKAVDSHRIQGSAFELLRQLAGHFSGQGDPPLRLVTNKATWHEYDWDTGEVTKTKVGDNWNWDGNTAAFWRGWVIIDSSAGPFGPGLVFGDPEGGEFDDGAVFGIDATEQQVQSLQKLVQTWKPEHVYGVRIIVTFDSTLFQRTNDSPPNPAGEYGDSEAWDPNAAYLLSGGKEP